MGQSRRTPHCSLVVRVAVRLFAVLRALSAPRLVAQFNILVKHLDLHPFHKLVELLLVLIERGEVAGVGLLVHNIITRIPVVLDERQRPVAAWIVCWHLAWVLSASILSTKMVVLWVRCTTGTPQTRTIWYIDENKRLCP